jgi:hypothetical protein
MNGTQKKTIKKIEAAIAGQAAGAAPIVSLPGWSSGLNSWAKPNSLGLVSVFADCVVLGLVAFKTSRAAPEGRVVRAARDHGRT